MGHQDNSGAALLVVNRPMLQTETRTRDFTWIRREVARIRAEADHAVEVEILHVDDRHPDASPSQRQRLISSAVRPHRAKEDAALRELTAGLSDRQRAELFRVTLDPHFAPRH